MSIVTLDQAKAQLNIDPADTTDDEELQGYVDAVTGVVEEYLGQVVEARTVTDRLQLLGATVFVVSSTPVISLTSVMSVNGGQVWDAANLDVDPDSGRVTVLSGPAVTGLVTVTYQAGYTVIPPRYIRGALVILQHTWQTQRGVGGVASGVDSEGNYDPRYSYSIPRKALEWLGPPLPGVA